MSEPTSTAKVRAKAHELLADAPKGIRYMDLHRTIAGLFPDIPKNTVHGALHKFRTNLPADIQVVTKGLYRHIKFTQAPGSGGGGDSEETEDQGRGLLPALCRLAGE